MRTATVLSNQDLIRIAPSVFAEHAHESMSEKYAYIPTMSLVQGLREEGFLPVRVDQAGSRKKDHAGFGKHMLRFRREDQLESREAREVVLINSHDGSSGFQLMAGVYRLVCSNGLIAYQQDCHIKLRHTGNAKAEVIEGAYKIINGFDAVTQSIETMKAITLSDTQKLAFGKAALALKYDDPDNCGFSPAQIIRPRRFADERSDLWTVFNAVQENVIKGGQSGIKTNELGRRVRTSSRKINGIDQSTALNRGLWVLAEEMGKLVA
jgi:hypothetical protein